MRIAIIGSRDYAYLDDVRRYVDSLSLDIIVVSGGARGVDLVAETRARQRGMQTMSFPVTKSDWGQFGLKAGPMRNTDVAKTGDEFRAFWNLRSRGTKDTMDKAKRMGKPVWFWNHAEQAWFAWA